MKINTAIQQFSSISGIKVTQSSNTIQSKNSEAINLDINTNTLNSLNLLSSLDKETFLKAKLNGYVNAEEKMVKDRLDEVYSKVNEENKKFTNPEQHIRDKYFSQASPYYIEGLSKTEREVASRHEIDYFKYGELRNISYIDPNIKDLSVVNGYVRELEEKAFNREAINTQFQQLLDKYGIEIPKDANITFTIEPYDFKVSVSGIEDKSLASLLEDVLNTADNSKELFSHIYKSANDENSQISKERNDKKSIFHEIKEKTGYDLRDLENVDGKFLTKDGTDILEIYKEAMIKSDKVPEEFKGIMYEHFAKKLDDLAKNGFENVPDLVLSIDYKNGSFYDVGQSENFGTGKTKWIEELKASKSQTLGEAFKNYRKDDVNLEDKQDIIREALNLNSNLKIEGKGLFDEYGTDDMGVIKLILMQKYLMRKEPSDADKEFYKLLKEFEDMKKE
ncbi:DUF4885 domain-containing protein [Aliarcobacter thereius]|uniref:DUF4885 domain-containing protein n=1 Tax=Aliarcobacter thereius TaxID=544718 RepID=A0A5R9H002_9BACT|nr:DUF4885 family protein [Aliarcobacter thereius]TLS72451.1 DUF4885 domain-containing protein [Aliarcobacter thereius]